MLIFLIIILLSSHCWADNSLGGKYFVVEGDYIVPGGKDIEPEFLQYRLPALKEILKSKDYKQFYNWQTSQLLYAPQTLGIKYTPRKCKIDERLTYHERYSLYRSLLLPISDLSRVNAKSSWEEYCPNQEARIRMGDIEGVKLHFGASFPDNRDKVFSTPIIPVLTYKFTYPKIKVKEVIHLWNKGDWNTLKYNKDQSILKKRHELLRNHELRKYQIPGLREKYDLQYDVIKCLMDDEANESMKGIPKKYIEDLRKEYRKF